MFHKYNKLFNIDKSAIKSIHETMKFSIYFPRTTNLFNKSENKKINKTITTTAKEKWKYEKEDAGEIENFLHNISCSFLYILFILHYFY